MKNLYVLLPGDPDTRTGGYIYDAHMVAGLRARNWQVNVIELHHSFPFADEGALADAAQQLAALPDNAIVLIDGLAFGAMAQAAHAHHQRLQLIALVHHPLADETGLSNAQAAMFEHSERAALQCARHVVVTGRRTAMALCERYAVAHCAISVIEPGTQRPHTQSVPPTKSDVDDPGVLRLLCVATVTPRKGHDVLIEALAALAGRPWALRCVGSVERAPDAVRAVRQAIVDAGLCAQVQLLGECSDRELAEAFNWADAFVLPTRLEGYGMALAEALAHGLPVITTRGGAAADLVGERAALLVDIDDVKALTGAVARLLDDHKLRHDMAGAAVQRAAQLPTWDSSADAMDALLSGFCRR